MYFKMYKGKGFNRKASFVHSRDLFETLGFCRKGDVFQFSHNGVKYVFLSFGRQGAKYAPVLSPWKLHTLSHATAMRTRIICHGCK